MATVTGFTAARMLDIENNTIVDAELVGDDLVFTKHDTTTLNVGSVRGDTGLPGIDEASFYDLLNEAIPVGTIKEYIDTTPPAGWAAMTGQTITNGQTLHPELWAILPASMKSGSNIIMPDTRGRVSVGYNSSDADFNAIGDTGGAKTHTLTTSEMPNHQHIGTTGNDSPAHHHALTGASAASAGTHSHNVEIDGNVVTSGGGPYHGIITSGGATVVTNSAGAHTHTLSGVTDGNFQNHQHAFTTSLVGGGGAHNNMPPFITFLKIIRVDAFAA